MMLWHLAQTTRPVFPDVPESWITLVSSLAALATAITGVLVTLKRQGTIGDRQDVQEKRQNVQEVNQTTLAAGVAANSKAINDGPGPNVPAEITHAAIAILKDPTTPTEPPPCIDPVPPPPPRVQT